MSMQEVIALTGLPATKKAKGSDHHNVDEPYPMELFHISDMDFVVVYYVKFLTKFEKLMCELLALYQEYARLSDDMASDVALQLSLVASNPRETYTESMVKAQNTMQWGRQSREHPWIRVQTDKRKSRKFGQDLIYMVKYMKSNDIDALHELMKQAPDLNTPDRETGRTVLQIALDKSCKQPSFAFVARYLALKQLLFQQKLVDESIIMQALKTHNPMVAEILLHLDPTLSKHDAEDRSALDLALNANYRNLARYMIKLNVPPWHTQQLMRRWSSACSMGDVVKLRSVLQRGFNIDFFQNDTQKTALIICTQEEYIDCVEFLLKNGCNVNAADVEQKTALHYAAQSLNGELFRMILESKANWTLRDLNTKTAIDYVMSNIGFVPRPKASKSTKQADNSSLQTPTNTRFRAGSGANQDSPTNTFQDNTPQSEERADDMYNKKTKFWRPSGFTLKIDADDDDDNWNQFGYLVQVQGDDDDDDDESEDDCKENVVNDTSILDLEARLKLDKDLKYEKFEADLSNDSTLHKLKRTLQRTIQSCLSKDKGNRGGSHNRLVCIVDRRDKYHGIKVLGDKERNMWLNQSALDQSDQKDDANALPPIIEIDETAVSHKKCDEIFVFQPPGNNGVIPHDYSQEHLHYLSKEYMLPKVILKNPEFGYKTICGAYNDFDSQMFAISFCCHSESDIRLQWFINGWNMRIPKKANFTKIWPEFFAKTKENTESIERIQKEILSQWKLPIKNKEYELYEKDLLRWDHKGRRKATHD
eukprot:31173_1